MQEARALARLVITEITALHVCPVMLATTVLGAPSKQLVLLENTAPIPRAARCRVVLTVYLNHVLLLDLPFVHVMQGTSVHILLRRLIVLYVYQDVIAWETVFCVTAA